MRGLQEGLIGSVIKTNGIMAYYQPAIATVESPPFEDPVTHVELSISAKDLPDKDLMSKSDPLCVLYIKERRQPTFIEVGRTEIIKNDQNPHWVKKFELDYHFEQRQLLKFRVLDWDSSSRSIEQQDALGEVECALGEIMARQGSHFQKPLSAGRGSLIVAAEEVSDSKEVALFSVFARDLDKKDMFGKSDPFLVIYRNLSNSSFVTAYRTEFVKNNLNPVWKPFEIPVKRLCGGEQGRAIKVECYDHDSDGTHDLIGGCETTLKRLKEGPGPQNTYTLIHPEKQEKKGSSYKGSGRLVIQSFSISKNLSFLDYIRGGLQIHFTVAIDFTSSNGNPCDPRSLHFRQPGTDNQYSLAIKAVGEIIQDYDTDKMFPALGFGARIPPDGQVSHEFFLNGRSDTPFCQGVQGILEAYYHSLQTVRLYGPTNFCPVIRHVSQFGRDHQDGSNYFVLLIITDGIISDLEETKKALIEASSLPVSVIIVGVGQEDFSVMELLDSDTKRLSYNGRYADRDIVQFVELRQFLSSNHEASCYALADAVLKEVPSQISEFMSLKSLTPSGPK